MLNFGSSYESLLRFLLIHPLSGPDEYHRY